MPRLAVDVFDRAENAALAATETIGNRIIVSACTRAVEQHGVRPGMTLGAALALCGGLQTLPRDPAAECARMNAIAAAAYGLSSETAFYGQDSIVLEIRGSLALFGGRKEFLRRARMVFAASGARFVFGIAPTPRAASWLTWHCPGRYVWFADELPAALRGMPIETLTQEEKRLRQLDRSGIRSLGAFMRLPRTGVTRRFGPELLHALDQALGIEPEPLALFAPPQGFEAAEELPLPSGDWPRLAPLAQKLLRRLEHYLLRRQAATQRLECLLWHEHEPATVLVLGLSRYERRAAQFLDLLQRHFDRTALPAEVTALGIRCGGIHVMPAENLHLLDGRAAVEQHWSELVDRLAARLGGRQLWKPGLRADHRPEKMGTDLFFNAGLSHGLCQGKNKSVPIFHASMQDLTPLWLLPRPERLEEREQRPHWNGSLELSRLPRRIEQGWWDGEDVKRDYYLARNPAGTRCWVYRDRAEQRWYLHGVFA
ncbi:MAG: DNA polymerase Y family protein [Gammaproteobacteria bacterium]|nr:DNA polymerase Y family protein [Gammaproteobacteria bacterium]